MSTTATIKWIKNNTGWGKDNGWHNANNVIRSGREKRSDGSGDYYNWRSVVCVQIPSSIGKSNCASKLVLAVTPDQPSYPYKSCAVLSSGDGAPIAPNKLTAQSNGIDVGPSKSLKSISLGQSFAYTSSEGKTERTYSAGTATLYYVFKNVQLLPGKCYYVYFMRESVGHSDNSHGTSGRISGVPSASIDVSPMTFTFEIKATLNNKKISEFPKGISIEVDGEVITKPVTKKLTSETSEPLKVTVSSLTMATGYSCRFTEQTYTLTKNITLPLAFFSIWTVKYNTNTYDDAFDTITVLYPYASCRGVLTSRHPSTFIGNMRYNRGITPTGWKFNGTKRLFGKELNLSSIDPSEPIEAELLWEPNSYTVTYDVDGITKNKDRFNFVDLELHDRDWIRDQYPNVVKKYYPTGWEVQFNGATYLYELGAFVQNHGFNKNITATMLSNLIVYSIEVGSRRYSRYFGDSLPAYKDPPLGKIFSHYLISDTNLKATWDRIYKYSAEDSLGNRSISLTPVFKDMYKSVVYQDEEIVSLTPVVISDNSYVEVIPYIYKGDN